MKRKKQEPCGKVFASGCCPAPVNAEFLMHTCERMEHGPEPYHTCMCGKSWTEVAIDLPRS